MAFGRPGPGYDAAVRTRAAWSLVSGALAAGGGLWWWGRAARVPEPAGQVDPPDGRPRLVRPVGGQVRYGHPASQGVEQEVPLAVGVTTVGRAATADVRLRQATVSPRHAELDVTADGRVRVRDLGSVNGVKVDGVPVAEADLTDGNRLELGEVVLVFKSDLALGAPGRQGGELG